MKIAFCGHAGSGKDTCCDYLIKKYGGQKLSFAGPIYQILNYAQEMCSFPVEKDRQFLQYIGTEWARRKEPNVWVNILRTKANLIQDNIYISDLRFANEYDCLQDFVRIKIERPAMNGDSHESERSVDSLNDSLFDYVLENDGTLEDLYASLDYITQIP